MNKYDPTNQLQTVAEIKVELWFFFAMIIAVRQESFQFWFTLKWKIELNRCRLHCEHFCVLLEFQVFRKVQIKTSYIFDLYTDIVNVQEEEHF